MTYARHFGLYVVMVAAIGCGHARKDVLGAQRAIARDMVAREDWQSAFAAANALCQDAPGDAEAHVLRGIVYREQGLNDLAEADLRQALELDANAAIAHSAIALLYESTGRATEAMRHHKVACELEPSNARFLNNYGFSLFAHGRPREAIEVLLQALRNAPTEPRIRNNLGFAYAATGNLSAAAREFDMAGSPADAKNNLGLAYERMGDRKKARELYSDALKLDASSTVALENRARLDG